MTLLLVEMAVVILVTLTCGWLVRFVGQSRVVGEIIGGILLGPSVFGRLAPHTADLLFPKSSFASLDILSTAGLVLFLFLTGMEQDSKQLFRERKTVAVVSSMSVLAPLTLGALLAIPMRPLFAPPGISATPFTLFMAISMSITALPVLARILEERRMQKTPLGVTAILCAAVEDVVGWLLLGVALAFIGTGNGPSSLSMRLTGLVVFVATMLGVVRPLAARLAHGHHDQELSLELLGLVIVFVLVCAAATDAMGIHPLFGAFLAGVCFPRVEKWQTAMRQRMGMLLSLLLLPLFFALTGMRTRLDLLSGGTTWMWAGIVLFAAVAGKLGGASLGARLTGKSWRDSVALGALMNTRGLVELVVLNIAYNVGAFSQTLFTMLVLMALITTMSTSPILNLLRIGGRYAAESAAAEP